MGTMAKADVLVIGAGVSGLTTAVCLAQEKLTVRILAKEPPEETTSAVAGASWGPYLVDDHRVLRWSKTTFDQLWTISADGRSGVRQLGGIEASTDLIDPPAWAHELPGFRRCSGGELPAGYRSGWWYQMPIVDMSVYLKYLLHRLAAYGVFVETAEVDSLAECADAARVLVNCSGLGARKLVGDGDMQAVRGQLVVVGNPGIDEFFQDDEEGADLTYILPHPDRVVLGGSAIPAREDLEPDPAITAGILERCAAVQPRLRGAEVRDVLVGLRPSRTRVRVEREERDGCTVIHNYGHGGSGVTMSWGCALEVLDLLRG